MDEKGRSIKRSKKDEDRILANITNAASGLHSSTAMVPSLDLDLSTLEPPPPPLHSFLSNGMDSFPFSLQPITNPSFLSTNGMNSLMDSSLNASSAVNAAMAPIVAPPLPPPNMPEAIMDPPPPPLSSNVASLPSTSTLNVASATTDTALVASASTAVLKEPIPGEGTSLGSTVLKGVPIVVGPGINHDQAKVMIRNFGGEVKTNLSKHTKYLVVVQGITRRMFDRAQQHKVDILLLDTIIRYLSGHFKNGRLDHLQRVNSYQSNYNHSLVDWSLSTACAQSKFEKDPPLLESELAVLPDSAITTLGSGQQSLAHVLHRFRSRLKKGGSMCGYLVELYKLGMLSADNVQYVELVPCNSGDHFRINGPAAVAQAMTGLYLNLKREDWSASKSYDSLVTGLQRHDLQLKTPWGKNPTEILVCHSTIAAGDFDAFSKLPGNVDGRDKKEIIKYYPPLKFNDDGTLVSFPNACTDGQYRYGKSGPASSKKQGYACCRLGNGCKARVTMDTRGKITKMWLEKGKTNPHSEECLNPPSNLGNQNGRKSK